MELTTEATHKSRFTITIVATSTAIKDIIATEVKIAAREVEHMGVITASIEEPWVVITLVIEATIVAEVIQAAIITMD